MYIRKHVFISCYAFMDTIYPLSRLNLVSLVESLTLIKPFVIKVKNNNMHRNTNMVMHQILIPGLHSSLWENCRGFNKTNRSAHLYTGGVLNVDLIVHVFPRFIKDFHLPFLFVSFFLFFYFFVLINSFLFSCYLHYSFSNTTPINWVTTLCRVFHFKFILVNNGGVYISL